MTKCALTPIRLLARITKQQLAVGILLLVIGAVFYLVYLSVTCRSARMYGTPVIASLEDYYDDHGQYPISLGEIGIESDIEWIYVSHSNDQMFTLLWPMEHWLWDEIGYGSVTNSWAFY